MEIHFRETAQLPVSTQVGSCKVVNFGFIATQSPADFRYAPRRPREVRNTSQGPRLQEINCGP